MGSEKDLEAEAEAGVTTSMAGDGAHGLRGGSSDQATMTEKESEHQRRHLFTSSDDPEKAKESQMEERKSFDVEDATDGEQRSQEDILVEPIQTTRSHASARSRLSRIASLVSRREDDNDTLPVTVHPLTDLQAGLVGWDSQSDPTMPMNFPRSRKWLIICFLAGITFMTPFASSILAPAISNFDEDFGNDDITLGTLPVSIYLLGYAVGPLFLAPLSEMYGRRPVLNAANLFFCAWLIGCALAPSLNSLIVFRFLTGIGGSGCLAIGGGVVADMFPVAERGIALAGVMGGTLISPTIAPIAGAYIAQDLNWRWCSWIAFIAATPMALIIVIFNQETNPRVLIDRKVARLSVELGRTDLRSVYDDPPSAGVPKPTSSQLLRRGLSRPLKLLFLSPILFSVSLYCAFAYGVLYLLFSTIPLVFTSTYGFSVGNAGLVYIPLGLGFIIGMAFFTTLSDRTVVRMTKANNGVYEPEMRLPDCIYFAALLPVTFFWYGWTAEFKTHWVAPVIGLLPFGVAILGIWQPIQAYVIDAYPLYAASAIGAFTVFRSVVAAFLPMAGPAMYDALGLGWGNSVLGFIAIALIPVPALIYKYGGRLRKWQKLEL
ncbi:MFS transporter prlG [Colletotrichum spaethianum]|uniref:MFS transporter prlG n=1 Tax=Colletotrichum spaethianum TaxID=700344 RepID=A0AA37LFM5_9PEZI|nr:MFS transporter prlG [Colletotrichum spaethianum]GKT45690.1 MFS transporter prlG [Colletotrichum spaethianum]